jgi:hypothetical protein
MFPPQPETDRSEEKGTVQLERLGDFFTNRDRVSGVMMNDGNGRNGMKNRRKKREWKRFETIVSRVLIVGDHDRWSAAGVGIIAPGTHHVHSQPNDENQQSDAAK